jgi:hypothetical protein
MATKLLVYKDIYDKNPVPYDEFIMGKTEKISNDSQGQQILNAADKKDIPTMGQNIDSKQNSQMNTNMPNNDNRYIKVEFEIKNFGIFYTSAVDYVVCGPWLVLIYDNKETNIFIPKPNTKGNYNMAVGVETENSKQIFKVIYPGIKFVWESKIFLIMIILEKTDVSAELPVNLKKLRNLENEETGKQEANSEEKNG